MDLRPRSTDILLLEPQCPLVLNSREQPGLPLGVGYVAAYLKAAGHSFHFEDLNAGNYTLAYVARLLRRLSPGVVGVSGAPWNQESLPPLFRLIKEVLPRTFLVVGGVLVRYTPRAFLAAHPEVDVVVCGEGEITFGELAAARFWEAPDYPRVLARIPGLAYRDGDEIRETPPRPLVMNLDDLPSPLVQGIFQLPLYTDIVMLLSSRGCPYRCIFCQWGGPGLPYRQHSLEYVMEDLKVLHRAGIRKIAFGDGTFNLSTRRLRQLAEAWRRHGFDFELYDVDCRAEFFTEEQARLLKELNAVDLGFGLETAHPRTQKLIRKHLDPEAVAAAVRLAKRYGFHVHVSMIVGLPGEGREEVLQTIRFIETLPVDYVGVFALRVQAGTPVAQQPELAASPLSEAEKQELVELARQRFRTINPRLEDLHLRYRLAALASAGIRPPDLRDPGKGEEPVPPPEGAPGGYGFGKGQGSGHEGH